MNESILQQQAQPMTFDPRAGVFSMPAPSVPEVWEGMVERLRQRFVVNRNECLLCGASRDEEHETVLVHCRGCEFEQMDQAVARLRAGGR